MRSVLSVFAATVIMTIASLTIASAPAGAQSSRGAAAPPDAYDFGPTPPYEKKYKHDPRNRKRILNPDFFCTQCVKEKRIDLKHRNDIRDQLETKKVYAYPQNGKDHILGGVHRIFERPGDDVLELLFKKMKLKKPIWIEDPWFRIFTDLKGFSTKKFKYPRREEELEQLADIFPRVSDKTVQLNSHHRAHLYHIRAKRVLREFRFMVKHNPKAGYMQYLGPYMGMKQKFEFYIFGKQRDAGGFLQQMLGVGRELDGICWHTLKENGMIAVMHGERLADVHLNNTFIHRAAYNYLHGFRSYGTEITPWFALGFGHLWERRERTDFNTFIFSEGTVPKLNDIPSKWKVAVRKMVSRKKVQPFARYASQIDEGDVSPKEHLVVWSMVSYLMQLDVAKVGQFIHILKSPNKGESLYNLQVRALRTVFGMTFTQFQERWTEWVLETYPAV